mgnify:CR=1 FL=1
MWEFIDLELLIHGKNFRACSHPQQKVDQDFRCLSGLSYQDHGLSWIECVEERNGKVNRFVFVTDIEADFNNVIELSVSGRMRFKIENEGFNTLKNGGYGLSHKFSRVSAMAMKNYVSLMQIAHLFNQLYELSSLMRPMLTGKETIRNLWKGMLGSLTHILATATQVAAIYTSRVQYRYE